MSAGLASDDAVRRAGDALDDDLARGAAAVIGARLGAALAPFVGAVPAAELLPLRPLFAPRGLARTMGHAVQRTVARLVRMLGRERCLAGDLDLVRPDGVLDARGAFRLFEINSGSCVGGLAEIEAMARVLSPWLERTLAGHGLRATLPFPLTALAGALARRFGRGARVVWLGMPGALDTEWGPPHAAATITALEAAGLAADAAEPAALTPTPDGLRLGRRRVDVLLRVIEVEDWVADENLEHLRAAVARGDVALFTSPFDRALGDKGLLAEAARAGDPIVPWTRLARPALEDGVDLLLQARADAARYVLKPAWGRQGERVAIGREDPARFAQLLVAAVIANDCVLQEYVAPPLVALPFGAAGGVTQREVPAVLSPLLVAGSAPSLCARVGTGATEVLTHPALGTTGLVPVVEVDASRGQGPQRHHGRTS